jgi:uncharacterized protein (TIGR02391 family)
MKLSEIYPDPKVLLGLEPEELGGGLLRYLLSNYRFDSFKRGNIFNPFDQTLTRDYPPEYDKKIRRALATAWNWLERESLIVPDPMNQDRDWEIVTDRGMRLANSASDLQNYRRAAYLRKDVIHPSLLEHVYATFLRGNYDTAVFEAFKEVEIAVRSAGHLPPELIGTDLMRKAFNPSGGPLSSPGAHPSEEQALSDLFAGAIGWAKNPASHRNVEIPAAEAAELITLASYLLRVVDSRRP